MSEKHPTVESLQNPGYAPGQPLPTFYTSAAVEEAGAFHRSMPEYSPTPLVPLPALSKQLGIGGIYVKDESKRFGLNAFKALGASFAVHKLLQNRPAHTPLLLVTATDGNHGKAVAWAAARAGGKSVVFMPAGASPHRVAAIAAISGARVEVTPWNYDDTVRHAAHYAQQQGAHLVQDTGLPGYEEIPGHIVLGYSTMASEALAQMQQQGIGAPTHVFLQAGVGSMAGGVLGYLALAAHPLPVVAVVEPQSVACLYASAGAGQLQSIGGMPETAMAGLNCGEPNPYTWPILRQNARFFIRCADAVTFQGMARLAKPLAGDPPVISGESGAVGLGLLMALAEPRQAPLRQALGLNPQSRVLLFSTEGDTDPESHRRAVEETAL